MKIGTKHAVLLFLLLTSGLFAGVSGKIQGVVRDKKSGAPLPSVTVVIQGTKLGASTNLDGEYIIQQIPPGQYTLKFSIIGYQELAVSDVQVRVDLTTRINAELEEKSYQLSQSVVIQAKRPIIQKDITSSIQFLGFDEMERLPVSSTRDGLFVQAGVFFDPIPVVGGLGSAGRGEPRYSIRGGSQNEIKWYVDGIRVSSLVNGRADWGGSFTNVNMNFVQEIQVMTGGFTAEYGEAQSGIVSVVTKEGGENWSGSAEYQYGFEGQHHFGNYLYDPKTEKEFLDHTDANGVLDTNWWTADRQHQIYDYRKIPDHTLNASLSGTLFVLNGSPLNVFLSGMDKSQAYSLPHPRDSRLSRNLFMNLSHRQENIRFRFTAGVNYDGRSTLQENGDFTNQAKYYRGWGSLMDTYNYTAGLQFVHVLTQDLFYEMKLSAYYTQTTEKPSEYSLVGASLKPTLFGFQRYDGYESEPFDRYSPFLKNKELTGDISYTGNLSWQINKSNLMKTGFEFRYNTDAQTESWRTPSFTSNDNYWENRGLNETYHPIQLAFFLQNKMEFESMILNAGVRIDYFDPNRKWFKPTDLYNLSLDPLYNSALDPDKDQVDSLGHVKYSYANVLSKERVNAKTYTMISPRFGVSFPISETSLLHFNYGHYYQMPPLDQMFEFLYFRPENLVKAIIAEDALAAAQGRAPKHIASSDGDPERVVSMTYEPLKPQKTIMFEVGIKQNFSDFIVLDVTAFYKDVFDQTNERVGLFDRSVKGYDPYTKQISPNQSYASYFPGDYGDSRGFEVSLKTLFSKFYNIDLNYSFSRSTAGRASPRQVIVDQNGNMTYVWDTDVNKRIPTEKGSSRPHILRANINLRYPDSEYSSVLNSIFNGTSLSILYTFVSGQTFTYLQASDAPDTYDNYRYPATQNIDLKIDKMINVTGKMNLSVYLQITNLLNAKNLRSYGDAVFDANATKNYVESGKVSALDAAGYDMGWQNYYETRRIYAGIKFSF